MQTEGGAATWNRADVMAGMPSSIGVEATGFSIVVPAYNEAATIEGVLERIVAATADLRSSAMGEIVVIDDGSADSTRAVVERFCAARPELVRLVPHERNAGLEAAIRTGVAAARHGAIVLLDADLSYTPDLVGPLLRTRARTGAAAVLASPYMAGGRVANVPRQRLIASRAANALLSLCVGGSLRTLTGMVRAYETAALREILARRTRGEFNTWVVAELLRAGRPVVEIPAELAWPRERYLGAPRLGLAALRRRTGQVIASTVALRTGYLTGRRLARKAGT